MSLYVCTVLFSHARLLQMFSYLYEIVTTVEQLFCVCYVLLTPSSTTSTPSTRSSRSCSSPTSRENLTSMKKAAPGPADEAVIKLLSKVGVTLEQALNSQELKWSSKHLDADDAHVVAHIVASSTVLQKLVLGANSIGDAGASSIAEALANSQPYASQAWHPLALICTCHHSRFPTPAPPGAQGQQRVAHACSW